MPDFERSRKARGSVRMKVGGLAWAGLLLACSPATSPPEPVPPARVVTLDESGFAELRAQQRGRVLLVSFWATWCEPCRDEFPALVRLDRKYHPLGLSIALISMDDPESLPAVQQFLKSQNAPFGSYLHRFRDYVAVVDSINPHWGGGIPATFLYDRKGILAKSWEGETSFKELEGAVQPLLP